MLKRPCDDDFMLLCLHKSTTLLIIIIIIIIRIVSSRASRHLVYALYNHLHFNNDNPPLPTDMQQQRQWPE